MKQTTATKSQGRQFPKEQKQSKVYPPKRVRGERYVLLVDETTREESQRRQHSCSRCVYLKWEFVQSDKDHQRKNDKNSKPEQKE